MHLQLEDLVGGGSSLLDGPIELEELYRTAQQRVDGKQKWSVQMYWTRVHGRSVTSRRILTT